MKKGFCIIVYCIILFSFISLVYSCGGGASVIPSVDTTAPSDPSGVSAVAGDEQVTLAWINPSESDFSGLTISWTPSGGTIIQPVTVGKNTTSQIVSGLSNGTAYVFTLSAQDGAGNISLGVTVNATPMDPTGSATININQSVILTVTMPQVNSRYALSDILTVNPTVSIEADRYQWYVGSSPLSGQILKNLNLSLSAMIPGTYLFTLIAVKGSLIASGSFVVTIQQ